MVVSKIGIFWDLGNCRVPKEKSPFHFIKAVREKFCVSHREAAFTAVTDVTKENEDFIESLNCAQIDVLHVRATARNAVNDKLKSCMHKFIRNMEGNLTLLLIAGDIDYASDLYEFRYQEHVKTVLIYQEPPHYSLLEGVNESYSIKEFCENIPAIRRSNIEYPLLLRVSSLPDIQQVDLKKVLEKLFANVGGKIRKMDRTEAIIQVANSNLAKKAIKRVQGQKVEETQLEVEILENKQSEEDSQASTSRNSKYQNNSPVKPDNAPEEADSGQELEKSQTSSVREDSGKELKKSQTSSAREDSGQELEKSKTSSAREDSGQELEKSKTSSAREDSGVRTTPLIFDGNKEGGSSVADFSILDQQEIPTYSESATGESQEQVKRRMEDLQKEADNSKRARTD